MDRRNFLKGMLAAGIGAAIIPYANLMKLGYKKNKHGFYVKITDSNGIHDYLCGDKVNVQFSDPMREMDGIITQTSYSCETEGILHFEMEIKECPNQKDQISLQMRTLNISMDSENPGLQICSEPELTSKRNLVSVEKMPKKS